MLKWAVYEKLPSFLRRLRIVAILASQMYQIKSGSSTKYVPTNHVKRRSTTVNMNSYE